MKSRLQFFLRQENPDFTEGGKAPKTVFGSKALEVKFAKLQAAAEQAGAQIDDCMMMDLVIFDWLIPAHLDEAVKEFIKRHHRKRQADATASQKVVAAKKKDTTKMEEALDEFH